MHTNFISERMVSWLQEISPRIYMAESDFDAITNNGLLCDADGNIGSDEFCTIMKTEIR